MEELKFGLTTSQVSNSWDLEVLVESLDTTFTPGSSNSREVVLEIERRLSSSFPDSRIDLRYVFEVCHSYKGYPETLISQM